MEKPRTRSSIQYKTAQASVGSHFCVQCCSSSDQYVVCRLTRESMWSVQEIVKTPKKNTELDHTGFRSEAYKPPCRHAHRSRRGRVFTHLAAPWPCRLLQFHQVASRLQARVQYVAPTHDDAARSIAAPVPLDAILWSVSCTVYACAGTKPTLGLTIHETLEH